MNINFRLLKLLNTVKKEFIFTVFFNILAGIITIFWARALSSLIDRVFIKGLDVAEIIPDIQIIVLLILFKILSSLLSDTGAAIFSAKIRAYVRKKYIIHLEKLGSTYINKVTSGALITNGVQGVELLDNTFSQYIPQIINALIIPIFILVVVFPIDWITGIVLILTGPLIPFFMVLIGKTSEKLTGKQFTALKQMSVYLLDTIKGINTLKMLNQSKKQVKNIAEVGEKYRKTTMEVLKLTFLSSLTLEWLSTLSVAIVAVEIGIRLMASQIQFEPAFFLLIIAPEYFLPLRTLGLRFHAGASGYSAFKSLTKIMDEPVSDREQEKRDGEASGSTKPPYEIELMDIKYAYPEREKDSLNIEYLKLEAGSVNAIIGKSGAGKSTLASLIMGLNKPYQGMIKVNGVNLAEIPPDEWHSNITWIPQKPFLFNRSIKENICLCNGKIDENLLLRAIRLAGLEKDIQSFSKGTDTIIGEAGQRISQGQAQRMVLARAFYRNTPILIMDEPTANLDIRQEENLLTSIEEICKDKTVLIIAHRLVTIKKSQKIIVLDHGNIIETGNHETLIQKNSYYKEFLKASKGAG